jgi:hypothetical protein
VCDGFVAVDVAPSPKFQARLDIEEPDAAVLASVNVQARRVQVNV